MLNLSSLLEKFKHLKNPREEKEKITSIISECLGFDIEIDSLELKNNIIYLNVSGLIKTELYMKKEQILSNLNKNGFKIVDLR
jgi:hypothetical protein